MKAPRSIFAFRSLSYLVLSALVGIYSASIIFEGSSLHGSAIFLLLAIVSLGHVLMNFVELDAHSASSALFAFFLADSVVSMVLVRASGSSSSPFLVLFPLLTLGGAVIFGDFHMIVLTVANLIFMSLGVGFGMAILGNGIAIVATSILGMYLIKALNKSGADLKISEGARRRLENLQKAILANIPSGLMSVDSQGRIIQINGVGLKILNAQESSIINMQLRELLPEVTEKIVKLNTVIPTDGSDYGVERRTVKYKRPNQATLDLGYSIARLSDPEDKSPLGFLVTFQDLTNVIKLEEDLRVTEKLAAVGKLAAGIAHEIRNPLAGISGSAQLLLGGSDMHEEDRKLLAIIQRESNRLDLLITEFLEYVKPQKPKLEPVNLLKLSEQVIESLKVNPKWNLLKCEAIIHASSEKELCASGDANKITQAVMNFLLNAGQAGAKRVEILVRGSLRGPVMEIRDNGKGISVEHQAHLFEPFFTTKESGTGLGLAISYKSLETMGARIQVVSPIADFSANGGTLFRLEFKGVAA